MSDNYITLPQLTKTTKGLVNKINAESTFTNNKIGDLADLNTTTKTDLVAAINEAAASGTTYDDTALAGRVTALENAGYITSYTETDPTVPAWAKEATKPTYTAVEVGALPDTTIIPEDKIFPVNVTLTSMAEGTSDKTHDEIATAVNAGKIPFVYINYSGIKMIAPLTRVESNYSVFTYEDQTVPDHLNYARLKIQNSTASIAWRDQYIGYGDLSDYLQTNNYITSDDTYTKTEIDGLISGVLHYKGTKATASELPSNDNDIGDVWYVTADDSEWAWDGSNWQELGTAVDLSAYRTATAQDAIDQAQDSAIAAKYSKPSDGIPASDLAAGVIPTVPTKTSDLTNDSNFVDAAGAAAAAPVQSINGKTGAVKLDVSDGTKTCAYAICITPADTATKVAYTLNPYGEMTGTIITVKFTNDVNAGAQLKVGEDGDALSIYYRGSAIGNGLIKATDTVTFVRESSKIYTVINIDRWKKDPATLVVEFSETDNYPEMTTQTTIAEIEQALADGKEVVANWSNAGLWLHLTAYDLWSDVIAFSSVYEDYMYTISAPRRDPATWTATEHSITPYVTSQDNGKMMVVDNGVWTAVAQPTIPNVPAWALAANKPTYTASEVGALPSTYTAPVTSVNGQTGAVNLTIPASQVQSDWNATSGMGVILNKPNLSTFMVKGTDYVTAGQKSETTLGNSATAEGFSTTASGNYSHAEGEGTIASGYCSHAEGGSTTASGYYSHAEGEGTTASGYYSHAEGEGTTSRDYSHAEGHNTTASGVSSHAEGNNTTASGNYSHAEGSYTTAQSRSQHVFGEYNILDTTGTITTKGQYVEIVGNGTSSALSNARTLDWSGNEVLAGKLTIGTAPTADMDVTTKQYVDSAITTAIGGINQFEVAIVTDLPTANIDTHTIYFKSNSSSGNNVYDEYIYINNNWELIGSTQVDLSNYLQTSDIAAWAKAANKPTYTAAEVGALPDTTVIPAAQVQSDWNATSGMGVILNKPTIPAATTVTNTLSSGTLIATINGTNIYAPAYTDADGVSY